MGWIGWHESRVPQAKETHERGLKSKMPTDADKSMKINVFQFLTESKLRLLVSQRFGLAKKSNTDDGEYRVVTVVWKRDSKGNNNKPN